MIMTVHYVDKGIVDCDIHVGYDSIADLNPYLSAATRNLLASSASHGFSVPSYPWQHPTGWIRKDTYSRDAGGHGQFPAFGLDQLREHLLDRYDVIRGITIPDEPAGFSVLPNVTLAAELCSAYNDWLSDHWLAREPRLAGTIVVPAQHPRAAAAEIRRLADRDEFVGVFLPGATRVPYGNPVYDPIWEAANEAGLPVVMHVHFEGVGISGPLTGAGHPDFYLEYHALVGSSLLGHLASVLCHGIFERFPDTRLMLMEGGLAMYAGLIWRLDTNWRACRSETPACVKPPSEYVWSHVRFTTQPLEAPPDSKLLRGVLEPLHPEQTLCFASDYPHWDFDEPRLTLRGLPGDWLEPILRDNAAAFYGLDVLAGAGA
jgi:uncharacterized protein